MKITDMTNKRCGHMQVVGFARSHKNRALWLCRCVCGAEKEVSGKHLRSGQVVSCGCMKGPSIKYPDRNARIRELVAANREQHREYKRKYIERNRERHKALNRINSSLMRAKRASLKPVPFWSEKAQIRTVYIEAKKRNWEVDHIVPINSKIVCGLHVWNNLQVLDRSENRAKGNRFWPDMPEYPRRASDEQIQALTA